MVLNILQSAAIHRVKTELQLIAKWHRILNKAKRRGVQIVITTDSTPKRAFASMGQWVFRSNCGAGVAADTRWAARCFACGTIYPNVVFPADRQAVEDALVVRADRGRNWRPGVTVTELEEENVKRGLPPRNARGGVNAHL